MNEDSKARYRNAAMEYAIDHNRDRSKRSAADLVADAAVIYAFLVGEAVSEAEPEAKPDTPGQALYRARSNIGWQKWEELPDHMRDQWEKIASL